MCKHTAGVVGARNPVEKDARVGNRQVAKVAECIGPEGKGGVPEAVSRGRGREKKAGVDQAERTVMIAFNQSGQKGSLRWDGKVIKTGAVVGSSSACRNRVEGGPSSHRGTMAAQNPGRWGKAPGPSRKSGQGEPTANSS